MRSPKLLAAILCLAGALGLDAAPTALKVGDAMPDFTKFKLEGKLPDTLKGKVVLLDFWASWCDPCKESFPVMEEFQKQYGPRGLVVIAINEDENRKDMEDFLKKNAVTFTVVRDAGQKLVDQVQIPTMPGSFIIDQECRVRFVHAGYRGAETKKKYQEEIESLLKK